MKKLFLILFIATTVVACTSSKDANAPQPKEEVKKVVKAAPTPDRDAKGNYLK
jgi:predicted component of type VI protein secretion system